MRFRCKLRRGVSSVVAAAFGLLLVVAPPPVFPQTEQASELASLRGTVRDAQGHACADVMVQLQSKDGKETFTNRTDLQGGYKFSGLHAGTYTLHVVTGGVADTGISSILLESNEAKTFDPIFNASDGNKSTASSAGAVKFYDQPQFTVSGVTDTTSLGGHGSDSVVRTRESLAKETVSLGNPGSAGATGRLAANEKSLRDALEHEPRSFDANHRLGRLLLESNRSGEAVPYLQAAAEIQPENYENSYDLAFAEERSGTYEQSRDQIRTLIAATDKAELHHLLGDVQEKLGDSLEAVHEYQRAAEMDPSEPYLFDWGSELLLHHAPEPAVEVFAHGNRLFPSSMRMLIGLGAALFAHGANEQAVQKICEASDLNPVDPTPYRFLGKMQQAQLKPSDEALEKLRRFVTLEPRNAEANYFYAVALWKVRSRPEDREYASRVELLLNNALQLNPKFAAADLQLGIVHAEQGNYPRAISDYQRAIEADPQMEEAHYRLGQALRQTGQTERSKQEIRIYDQLSKQKAQQIERERHEIRQFVYTLRDTATPQSQ